MEVRDISSTLFEEVILPAAKNILTDFVSSAVEMLLYGGGESRGPSRTTRGGHRRRNYNKSYDRRSPSRRSRAKVNRGHEVSDLYFDDRADAEIILGMMYERLQDYGVVTVGDLYSMVGKTSNHNHEQIGWVTLDRSNIRHTVDGFIIDLLEPEYLK